MGSIFAHGHGSSAVPFWRRLGDAEAMLESGAVGYLAKTGAVEPLVRTLRACAADRGRPPERAGRALTGERTAGEGGFASADP